jgi:hypothetical protein
MSWDDTMEGVEKDHDAATFVMKDLRKTCGHCRLSVRLQDGVAPGQCGYVQRPTRC